MIGKPKSGDCCGAAVIVLALTALCLRPLNAGNGDVFTPEERSHWSLQPRSMPAIPLPASGDAVASLSNPVDAFILDLNLTAATSNYVAFTNYWFCVPYPGFPFTFRFPPTSLVDEVSNARPHRLRLFMRTLLAVGEKQGRQPEQ